MLQIHCSDITFPQLRVTQNKVHCDIYTVINAWRTSQITASEAATQRIRRWWNETGAVEHTGMLTPDI